MRHDLASVVEAEPARLGDVIHQCRRGKDFAALRLCRDARGQNHGEAEEFLRVAQHRSAVSADANADRLLGMLLRMRTERALERDGAGQRAARVGEGE